MSRDKYNFYDFKEKRFSIKEEELERFRNLKHIITYDDSGRCWNFSPVLYWDSDETLDMDRCKVYVSMMVRFATDEDIDKAYGKDWYPFVNIMLKRTYFDSYENELTIANKRPFGNSAVETDVFECVRHDKKFISSLPESKQSIFNDPDWDGSNVDLLVNDKDLFNWIMNHFYDVIIALVKNYQFEYDHWDIYCDSPWLKNVPKNIRKIKNEEGVKIIERTIFKPNKRYRRNKILDKLLG